MQSRLSSRLQHTLVRPAFGSVAFRRTFWNVSLPITAGPGGAHITKYHIVKPGKEDVQWDDFLMALPERDHLMPMTKDVPLFVRFLKVLTDNEGRTEHFQTFLQRAKDGLVVENDVFITTEELLALMWKNGYGEQERNAVQFTFPSDYKFHYPEVSVMFDIPEEDTYKFCMRTRMENSHIGQLDWNKVKPKGLMRTHWLIFGTGVFTFKFFPFFNYYFGIKVFGTSMFFWTWWHLLNRVIATSTRRFEHMAAQKTAKDVMKGEDDIVTAMQRFVNDSKCVQHLENFKPESEEKIAEYKKALVLGMKASLTERASQQLKAVSAFESSAGAALQEVVVREAAASFREKYPTDKTMQSQAFTAAVKSLKGETLNVDDDPVSKFFNDEFALLGEADLSSLNGKADGTLSERVAHMQHMKEKEFRRTFMVTPEEASEVRSIASEAKVNGSFDIGKLSTESSKKLDELYTTINAKVGYSLPETLGTKPIEDVNDEDASPFVEEVNTQLAAVQETLRIARLKAFLHAF